MITIRLKCYALCFTLIILLVFIFNLLQVQNLKTGKVVDISERIKEIVGLSLQKQIEIDTFEIECSQIIQDIPKEQRNEPGDWIQIGDSQVYIYSIHHDLRLAPFNYLRVLAMIKDRWRETVFCQILSEDGSYRVTEASVVPIWYEGWDHNNAKGYYNPVLISCALPPTSNPGNIKPFKNLALTLKNPCFINGPLLQIPAPQPLLGETEKNNFTICVKPLNYKSDISKTLLQWILINQLFGADKFVFYLENIKLKKMFYERQLQSLKTVTMYHHHRKIVKRKINGVLKEIWQRRRYELIVLNDCLYRNVHISHYIIPLDLDELIVPMAVTNWSSLFQELQSNITFNYASYSVRNTYFPYSKTTGNETINFFRDLIRTGFSEREESGKSFVSTERTLLVTNHYALRTLRPGIKRVWFLDSDRVQLNHYKSNCSIAVKEECDKYFASQVRVHDSTMLKYKKRFYNIYSKLINNF